MQTGYLTIAAAFVFATAPAARADAFVFSNGVFTPILVPGALPGQTFAYGINNLGQIVGAYSNGDNEHGFIDTDGVITAFDAPGARLTAIAAINDSGDVAGTFGNVGFLDSGGVFTPINSLVLPVRPGGINNAGQVAGSFGFFEGFLFANGIFAVLPNDPAAAPGRTAAEGINDAGQIVGFYETFNPAGTSGFDHGFIYQNGNYFNFDAPGVTQTTFNAINNLGQIVGEAGDLGETTHGLLYDNGVFTEFDAPNAVSTTLTGINDSGQIVGNFTPIPEPGSLFLLISAAGAGILMRFVRLRNSICS